MHPICVTSRMLLFTAALLSPVATHATDYNREIEKHLIVPCMRTSLTALGQTAHIGLSDHLLLKTMMDTNMRAGILLLYIEVKKHVRGHDYERRLATYRHFANFCIESMLANNR